MIIILIHNLKSGGAQKVAINTFKALQEKKIKTKLIVMNPIGELINELDMKKSNVHFFKTKKSRYFIFKLAFFLKKNSKYIVFSMIREMNLVLGICKFFRLIDNKITGREANPINNWSNLNIFLRPIYRILLRLSYNSFNCLIFNSNFTKDSILNFINIKKSVIKKVIGNPIIFKNYKYVKKIPKKKIILTTIGRLEKQKNHSYIIDAFNLALKNNNNLYLQLIGNGSFKNKLKNQIKNLNLEKKVKIIPYTDNVYKILKNTDLFIMASLWEGFGNVIVEALYMNCRILSLKSPGGINEILENGKFGKILPIHSSRETYADHINKEIESKSKLNTRNKALEYDYLKITDQYIEHMIL